MPSLTCDCTATPEDKQAGIHEPGCTSTVGEPDQPSDHYTQ